MIGRIIFCCLLFSLNAAAQKENTIDSLSTEAVSASLSAGAVSAKTIDSLSAGAVSAKADTTRHHTIKTRFQQLLRFLDKKAHSAVDPHYIEVPAKPWRIILRLKGSLVDVDYYNGADFPETNERAEWQLHFRPPVATSVGIWVGYRGTGLGFSKSLTKNAGRNFTFSSTGAKYGINFRLTTFESEDAKFAGKSYKDGIAEMPHDTAFHMPKPVSITSIYLNGYYVFNGRHYSQAAAYNQSVIQRRSAGSLLVGATWYMSSFDYNDIANGFFMILGDGISRIKVHQANIGVGYGFNWVPLRGLVINAMAMPTISVYNRVKVYKYDFNYCLAPPEPVDDYGEWNKETKTWANGKEDKPITMLKPGANDIYYWNENPETNYSALRLNVDVRVGIAYNWSNFFIGLQAQFNNFIYRKDESKVNVFDSYARLNFGIRL
jgi:hypothetical protein